MVAEDVVAVVVTISKLNGHTMVDAEDAEDVGDVAVHINVCDLTTMETHPMELIGWRISSMNQIFANFLAEKKTLLYELKNNRSATPPPETPKVASVESRLLQLKQLAGTLPPPKPIVASRQGVSQVGVQPQYTNATNTALQQLNQWY